MRDNITKNIAKSIARSIKTATVALAIAVGVTTASTAWGASVEQYVYSRDGATIVTAPRALPSVGVRISDNQLILGLHGASDIIKASCGWYRVVPADDGMIAVAKATAAENHNGDVTDMVVDKVSYELTGEGTAVTVRTYKPKPEPITLEAAVQRLLQRPEFANLTDEAKVEELAATLLKVIVPEVKVVEPEPVTPLPEKPGKLGL